MGVGLYLRDIELSCFTDYEETPIPDYLVNSKMIASNVDSISRVLQLLSDAVHHGSGYVSSELDYINILTKQKESHLTHPRSQSNKSHKEAPQEPQKSVSLLLSALL